MDFEKLTKEQLELLEIYAKSVIDFCDGGIKIAKQVGGRTADDEYIKGAESTIKILKGDLRRIKEILEERS